MGLTVINHGYQDNSLSMGDDLIDKYSEDYTVKSDEHDVLAYYLAATRTQHDKIFIDGEDDVLMLQNQAIGTWQDLITNIRWSTVRHWKKHVDEGLVYVTEPVDFEITLANKIRRYYSDRFMMASLKGKKNHSQFRTDLYKFCTEMRTEVHSNYLGMMARLPFFYQYDLTVDKLLSEHYTDKHKVSFGEWKLYDGEFRYLERTVRAAQGNTRYEYWFATEFQTLMKLDLGVKNPLRAMYERRLEAANGGLIPIKGNYHFIRAPGRSEELIGTMTNWDIF